MDDRHHAAVAAAHAAATLANKRRARGIESPGAAEELLEEPCDELMGRTDCPADCEIEPDGICPHGYLSAGLTAGLI